MLSRLYISLSLFLFINTLKATEVLYIHYQVCQLTPKNELNTINNQCGILLYSNKHQSWLFQPKCEDIKEPYYRVKLYYFFDDTASFYVPTLRWNVDGEIACKTYL